MRPLTPSCFLLLSLGRVSLLALPVLLGTSLFLSLWSPPMFLHAPALIPLFLVKVRLSLTLTLPYLTIWCSGLTALFLFLLARAVLAYLPTALSVALRPLFFFCRPSMLKFFCWSLRPCTSFMLCQGLDVNQKRSA